MDWVLWSLSNMPSVDLGHTMDSIARKTTSSVLRMWWHMILSPIDLHSYSPVLQSSWNFPIGKPCSPVCKQTRAIPIRIKQLGSLSQSIAPSVQSTSVWPMGIGMPQDTFLYKGAQKSFVQNLVVQNQRVVCWKALSSKKSSRRPTSGQLNSNLKMI